jgi:methylmalonyl-CoA mutase cobalamin-binding subunit
MRFPEQDSLKQAHQALQDLSLVMDDLGMEPTGEQYAHAANLAAHLTSSLTAGDHHRRFAEAEGIARTAAPFDATTSPSAPASAPKESS